MVSHTHPLYLYYQSQARLTADVIEGDFAIKRNAKAYFKPLDKESDADYNARISRPAFDNLTGRFLENLTGLIFAKAPIFSVTDKVENIMEDLDMDSLTHIDIMQVCVNNIFRDGRVGILVDVSNTEILESMPNGKADLVGRKFVKVYPNNSIINWKYAKNKLQLVVLVENVETEVNEFESNIEVVYRVLSIQDGRYRVRVIKENNEVINDIYPTKNGKNLDFIPFYVCNAQDLSINPTKPPLFDMSNNNIALHRLKIELYHALYFIAPTAYLSGVNEHEMQNQTITLGSSNVLRLERSDAKLNLLELKGDSLGASQQEMKNCKDIIASLGADFLREKPSSVSTKSNQIYTSADRATLTSVANTASRMMTKVLKTIAWWNDEDDTQIIYNLNTDYDLTQIDSSLIRELNTSKTLGTLSLQDIFYNFKKGDLIESTLTFEEWKEQLDNDSISLMTPKANNANS